eukprot:scaffold323296_cov24-Tisochrysis_lutea.AAC.1
MTMTSCRPFARACVSRVDSSHTLPEGAKMYGAVSSFASQKRFLASSKFKKNSWQKRLALLYDNSSNKTFERVSTTTPTN